MRIMLCLGTLMVLTNAFAGTLKISYANDKKEIPVAATLNATPLERLGTGIRKKRIVINFDVYRATLFASHPKRFSRSLEGRVALDSLKVSDAYALHLQFLRDVSAKDVIKSFNEALSENGIKESPGLKDFRDAIIQGGDLKKGSSMSLSVDNQKGILECEHGKALIEVKGDVGSLLDIFSIWLGEKGDIGVQNLKKALISG